MCYYGTRVNIWCLANISRYQRRERDKILLQRSIESKEFVLWRYTHRTSSTEERELLVSSPRKSVKTQAHLSASNIDRARLLQVPLSPPVALRPLYLFPLASSLPTPPYRSNVPFLRANKRHRTIFHVSHVIQWLNWIRANYISEFLFKDILSVDWRASKYCSVYW